MIDTTCVAPDRLVATLLFPAGPRGRVHPRRRWRAELEVSVKTGPGANLEAPPLDRPASPLYSPAGPRAVAWALTVGPRTDPLGSSRPTKPARCFPRWPGAVVRGHAAGEGRRCASLVRGPCLRRSRAGSREGGVGDRAPTRRGGGGPPAPVRTPAASRGTATGRLIEGRQVRTPATPTRRARSTGARRGIPLGPRVERATTWYPRCRPPNAGRSDVFVCGACAPVRLTRRARERRPADLSICSARGRRSSPNRRRAPAAYDTSRPLVEFRDVVRWLRMHFGNASREFGRTAVRGTGPASTSDIGFPETPRRIPARELSSFRRRALEVTGATRTFAASHGRESAEQLRRRLHPAERGRARVVGQGAIS